MPTDLPLPATLPSPRVPISEAGPRDFRVPGTDSEGKALTIPRRVSFSGRIGRCQQLVVEGVLETDLDGCRELAVAGGGIFRGAADVDVADIRGIVEGTLTVRRMLTLRSSGRIASETLSCGELKIERGGILIGTVRRLAERAW